MNYRIRAGLLAGLSVSLIAGCAHLPQGYPSRTSHAPVDGNSATADPGTLFVDTGAVAAADSPALDNLKEAPTRGLRIRKSKRGNMDSYVVRGQRYFTLDSSHGYSARGLASWYGPNFHGRVASNGEIYDMYRLTAAHKTLPLPTYARVTHLDNGKSIIVKINDRGPFSGDRLIDLSFAAALELDMVNDGTAMVEIKALEPEELLVMSGPDNKLGIDFYYDYREPVSHKQKVAIDALFVDDRTQNGAIQNSVANANSSQQAAATQAAAPLAAAPLASNEAVAEASVDSSVLPEAALLPAVDSSVAAATPVSIEGTVVDLASIDAEFIEVVVPGRRAPSESQGQSPVSSGANRVAGKDIPLQDLVNEQPVVAEVPAKQTAVPLVEPAALPVNATGTLPALATAALPQPSMQLRYYLQAGVFADVNDAERLATDIVLEIPREEVHVKPLKDSAMYRVTVGPIVSADHAREVSSKLNTAGIENYTVKVNES